MCHDLERRFIKLSEFALMICVVLLVDMGSKATLFSEEAGGATALAVLAAGGIYLLTQRKDKEAQEES